MVGNRSEQAHCVLKARGAVSRPAVWRCNCVVSLSFSGRLTVQQTLSLQQSKHTLVTASGLPGAETSAEMGQPGQDPRITR